MSMDSESASAGDFDFFCDRTTLSGIILFVVSLREHFKEQLNAN